MKKYAVWAVLFYLRFFARLALQYHRPYSIGIGGSVGKSSTRNALAAILTTHYPTKVISGNSETGIPLGILGLSLPGYTVSDWLSVLLQAPFHIRNLKKTTYLIIEMGIDEPDPPKNMEYLLTIIKPDIAISLNIAGPHLGQFEKTLDGKHVDNPYDYVLDQMAKEDTKIITQSGCSVGIYNADDKRINHIMHAFSQKEHQTKLLTFGENNKNTISYIAYEINPNQTTFTFIYDAEKLALTFHNVLLPREYREVFAPVILAAKQIGLNFQQIKEAIETHFVLPKGRASILEGVSKSTIIDSSYNAPPKAVKAFLLMLQELEKQTKRPVVFLMGDMRELGNAAKHEHEALIPLIHEVCDYLYCVGPLTMEYILPHIRVGKDGLKEAKWFENSVKAGEYLRENMPEKALVLVKGSQNTIFLEEGIKQFLADRKDTSKLCRQESYWKK